MAEIRINATGGVKLYDADDSHYAQIVAGTITSNVDAITLGHDTVTIADNLSLGSDSAVLKFGADGDTTLTHTDGTGLTLNSTNKLCFNDASQFIQGSSNAVLSLGATDEIDLTATAVDLNGTLNVSGVATFQSTPVFPDGSLALADLDIDGGTDIGAAVVDADLFIVDDGAGGTNRKVTASRIKTYVGGNNTPLFYGKMGSNQTVASEAMVKLTGMTTNEIDNDSVWDGSKFLPGVAGWYYLHINIVITWASAGNDGHRAQTNWYFNGSDMAVNHIFLHDSASTALMASGSDAILQYFDADDYMEIYVYTENSGNTADTAVATYTHMEGFRIA